jgi:hypothetical protein
MVPRKKRGPRWWLPPVEPKWVASFALTILGSVGSFVGSQRQSDTKVQAARNEANDDKYVLRCKVDSLTVEMVKVQREVRVMHRRLKMRDRYDPIPLTYLGPPAPERKSFFRRLFGR